MVQARTVPILRSFVLGAHLVAGGLALAASAIWPAAGTPAMLVPIGLSGREQAFAWMAEHDAMLVATQASGERLIVFVPSSLSAFSALAHGYLPVAAEAVSCEPSLRQATFPERSTK